MVSHVHNKVGCNRTQRWLSGGPVNGAVMALALLRALSILPSVSNVSQRCQSINNPLACDTFQGLLPKVRGIKTLKPHLRD